MKKFNERLGSGKLIELVVAGQGKQAATEISRALASNIVSFHAWGQTLSGSDGALCEVLQAYLNGTGAPYHGPETTKGI